jgi:hypothetical protein
MAVLAIVLAVFLAIVTFSVRRRAAARALLLEPGAASSPGGDVDAGSP